MNRHPIDFEGRGGIRCVQQLGILKLWERLTGAAELPFESRVAEEDIARLRDKLMLCDVEWRGDEPLYRIRYHGPDFVRTHGRDCTGQLLNDVMAPVMRARGLQTYRSVIDLRRPAFNMTQIHDQQGRSVDYERLLLPFTSSGQGVEHIYCVVTLFTEDNRSPFETVRHMVGRAD